MAVVGAISHSCLLQSSSVTHLAVAVASNLPCSCRFHGVGARHVLPCSACPKLACRTVPTPPAALQHHCSRMACLCRSAPLPRCLHSPAVVQHGDIGILGPHDLLVCFSKSGATEEIIRLVPFAKASAAAYMLPVRSAGGLLALPCCPTAALKSATPLLTPLCGFGCAALRSLPGCWRLGFLLLTFRLWPTPACRPKAPALCPSPPCVAIRWKRWEGGAQQGRPRQRGGRRGCCW